MPSPFLYVLAIIAARSCAATCIPAAATACQVTVLSAHRRSSTWTPNRHNPGSSHTLREHATLLSHAKHHICQTTVTTTLPKPMRRDGPCPAGSLLGPRAGCRSAPCPCGSRRRRTPAPPGPCRACPALPGWRPTCALPARSGVRIRMYHQVYCWWATRSREGVAALALCQTTRSVRRLAGQPACVQRTGLHSLDWCLDPSEAAARESLNTPGEPWP